MVTTSFSAIPWRGDIAQMKCENAKVWSQKSIVLAYNMNKAQNLFKSAYQPVQTFEELSNGSSPPANKAKKDMRPLASSGDSTSFLGSPSGVETMFVNFTKVAWGGIANILKNPRPFSDQLWKLISRSQEGRHCVSLPKQSWKVIP